MNTRIVRRCALSRLFGARLFCAAAATILIGPQQSLAQDPYPQQAIAFFNAKACPGGWTPTGNLAGEMNGRFVVPLMENGETQKTVGSPLASGENRVHNHSMKSSISLPSHEYHGAGGCCNHDVASDGTKTFKGTTTSKIAQIPYVQALACVKVEPAGGAGSVPPGVLIFFAGLDCPAGWTQPTAPQGRLVVGLPDGGTPTISFGGPPLKPQEDRTHAHGFSGQVSTTAQGILDFIGKATGYGTNGTYRYSGTSSENSTGLPYIQLLQCQKE